MGQAKRRREAAASWDLSIFQDPGVREAVRVRLGLRGLKPPEEKKP